MTAICVKGMDVSLNAHNLQANVERGGAAGVAFAKLHDCGE